MKETSESQETSIEAGAMGVSMGIEPSMTSEISIIN